MSQTTLDLDSRLKLAKRLKDGERRNVVVSAVKEESAKMVFGERATQPAKPLFVLYASTAEGKPAERVGFFNAPFDGVTVSEKSNLVKFQKKYGSFPKAGLTIEIIANSKGYWRPSLD